MEKLAALRGLWFFLVFWNDSQDEPRIAKLKLVEPGDSLMKQEVEKDWRRTLARNDVRNSRIINNYIPFIIFKYIIWITSNWTFLLDAWSIFDQSIPRYLPEKWVRFGRMAWFEKNIQIGEIQLDLFSGSPVGRVKYIAIVRFWLGFSFSLQRTVRFRKEMNHLPVPLLFRGENRSFREATVVVFEP